MNIYCPYIGASAYLSGMKEFTLTARVTVSAYTIVEAETLEEAIKIANERPVDFHQHVTEEEEREEWIVSEIDGEAVDIEHEQP